MADSSSVSRILDEVSPVERYLGDFLRRRVGQPVGGDTEPTYRNHAWKYPATVGRLGQQQLRVLYERTVNVDVVEEEAFIPGSKSIIAVPTKGFLYPGEIIELCERASSREKILVGIDRRNHVDSIDLAIVGDAVYDASASIFGLERLLPPGYKGFLMPLTIVPSKRVMCKPVGATAMFLEGERLCREGDLNGDEEDVERGASLIKEAVGAVLGLDSLSEIDPRIFRTFGEISNDIVDRRQFRLVDLTGKSPTDVVKELFEVVLLPTYPTE